MFSLAVPGSSIKQGMTVAVGHVRPLQCHSDSTKTQQQSPRWGLWVLSPAGVRKPAAFLLISLIAGYLKRNDSVFKKT